MPSPADPTAAAAPAIPPSSASAPGVLVPPAPGEEAQAVAPAPIDPATGLPIVQPGAVAPPTSTGAARQRARSQQQLQVRDQVMRNLNNAN